MIASKNIMGKGGQNMKTPAITVCALIMLFLLFGSTRAAAQADISGSLPPGTEDVLREIQRTMYPPWLYSVTLAPDPPRAGEPVAITAEIYNDPNVTDDETIEAFVFFSVDEGVTWETVEMDGDEAGRIWTAELPAFESGTEVWYGFRAGDATGNVFTETPCYVTTWPPKDDSCMFELSMDDPPVDDAPQLIPADFDFLGMKGGVDEDNLYLELSVQGSIDPGSMSPVFLHLYGVAVANMDKGNASDIVSQGFLGIYAPLAHIASYDSCMTVSRPASEIIFAKDNIQCEFDGDRLWFKVDNRQIGNTDRTGHLKIIAADGAVTSIAPLTGIYYDYTHVSSLSLASRSFVVK